MGRKRKPDTLKVVAGTAQKCRMNPNTPNVSGGIPVAPDELTDRAAEIFNRLSSILAGMGIGTPDDVDGLSILAQRLDQIETLNTMIEDGGYTYSTEGGLVKANPAVAMRDVAMRHAQSLLSEFGLTPAARSKVSARIAPDENPFAAFG